MIRRLVLLVLFLICFRFAEDFCHQKTRGFTLFRIQARNSLGQALTPPPVPVQQILNQKFTYFADGKQTFVFLSADEKYVLKFFKRASAFPPIWTSKVPLLNRFKPFRAEKIAKDEEKRKHDYEGYSVAFQHLAPETGLIWVQLSHLSASLPKILLIDPLGIQHQLDLNSTHFVLQKRATPVFELLQQWSQNQETDKLRSAIFALLDFCQKRASKGIYDKDAALYKNFAFLDGRVIQVDPGLYQENSSFFDPSVRKQDLALIANRFKKWLKNFYPQLIPYVDEYASTL